MANKSQYNSKVARPSCSGQEFYRFITDMRNFTRFVPGRKVDGWLADEESCRFDIPPMGEMSLKISSKIPCSLVKYSGTVLVSTAFDLNVSITGDESGKTNVQLSVEADLDPVIKIVASDPIERFLDTIVDEMEKYDGWKT